MRIYSWGQATGAAGAQALGGACQQHTACDDRPEASDGALQVAVSKPAELIQKLSALKSADPAAFKLITGRIAEQFESMANLASGPASRALGQLAQQFASAAENGDLSAFDLFAPPPAPAPAAPPPAAPAAPPPPDAGDTALALIDGLTGGSGDPVQRLLDLKASDQAAFKRVMNNAAEQLEHLGNLAGSEGEGLRQLAATFASGAENGDLSAIEALRPPAPPAPPPPPAPPAPEPAPFDVGAAARGIVDALASALAPNASGSALEKLGILKSSDQATFKLVMGRAAEQLEQLANLSEGNDRDSLQSLALQFASGAESGDLSGLALLEPQSAEATPTAPPPAPPEPEAPAPVDAKAAALSVLGSLTTSSGGDTVAQLTSLKTSDLASFQRIMNQAAQQLESMANLADESDRASLQQLAVSFASSAESGDLAVLQGLAPPSAEPTPPPSTEPTPPPAAPTPVDDAPEAPAPESPASPWLCNQAREAYARCASPHQTLSAAFSAALAIVDSLAPAAA